MMKRRNAMGAMVATTLSLGLARAAHAAWTPDRPLKIILPTTPGGASDKYARLIADRLRPRLGQPVVIDYKPGGGQAIAGEFVARQPPDGYTMLLSSSGFNLNSLLTKTSYDPIKDFTQLIHLADVPMMVAVNPAKVSIRTPQDLIAWAKANQERAFYGLPVRGATGQLIGELINLRGHLKMQPVVYKGGAPMVTDLLAGQIPVAIEQVATFREFVKTGQLALVAAAGKTRATSAPQVQTLSETVFPGFDINAWFAIQMPRGVPADIVSRLNLELNEIMKDPLVVEAYTSDGAIVVGGSSDAATQTIMARTANFNQIVKDANIKLDATS